MPAVCELTPWSSPVGGADGGWRGAYGWSNKPPPLARKMLSRLFKYRWASLASKEGAFTKKRHLTTTIGGYTHTITVGIGFPQGGVCSAKFWIIAFNEAIEIINEYGVTGQGFADDCGPMIGGNNTHDMYKSMQRMLNKLYHWGEGKNLKFNPTKTVVVLFSKKHKSKQKFLKLGGKFI